MSTSTKWPPRMSGGAASELVIDGICERLRAKGQGEVADLFYAYGQAALDADQLAVLSEVTGVSYPARAAQ